MSDFLFSLAMTVIVIGLLTLAHWVWVGRRRPLNDSYYRALLYLTRWLGTAFAAFAALVLAIASADLLLGLGMGYPAWTFLFCVTAIAVGLVVRWMVGLWLAGAGR